MNTAHTNDSESIWFCEIDDQVSGPFSFHCLKEMAKNGTLRPNDQLRKGNQIWVPARRVSGLFSEYRTFHPGKKVEEVRSTLIETERSFSSRRLQRSLSGHALKWFVGGLTATTFAIGGFFFLSDNQTFPAPFEIAPKPLDDPMEIAKTSVFRAPVPDLPSITGIPLNTLLPIPGLEDVSLGFSPTLTGDLNTIVFAGKESSDAEFDLFIANRGSALEKFAIASPILSCNSAETESHCSISSNGLELVFLRAGTIMYSIRQSRTAEFSSPGAWQPIDFDFDMATFANDAPQFVGKDAISFCRQPKGLPNASREFYISNRDQASPAQFGKPQAVLFDDNTPCYTIAADRKRAYVGSASGVSFVIRGDDETPFSNSRVIVSVSSTGTVDGPVWVPPKEDIVFFCSTGSDQLPGIRKLWMVRY